ncbi:MAG TPA: spermidine synthase, partial [Candidatus Nitrosotalea sp.]|nr:spermidine synthase [Candidatus Nitrosotalea sp.]
EGATLREGLRSPDVARCTMVDIDATVVELSKKYLPEWSDGAFDDPRARVVVGDALAFMRDDRERYGVILSDLTEPLADSPSNPLFNDAVFKLIKSRLEEGGIYVLQASTGAAINAALHCKMARTLRRHYANVVSFVTHVPAFDTEWAFLACSDRVDLASLESERIEAYCAGLRGESFFYDALTHRRVFALPLYLRRMLAAGGDTF